MIRVLIADDHALMREGLTALLEASGGIEVIAEANNGREAIREAERHHPDVVLMDIAMQGIDGIDTVSMMRQKLPGVRVVMLSMLADVQYIHRALAAGALGYVLKESAASELLAAVRAAHAGKRHLSQQVAAIASDMCDPQREPLERLTSRERQILEMVVAGRSSTEISDLLNLSRKTVETYRSRLNHKLGVRNVASLVRFALRHGVPSA